MKNTLHEGPSGRHGDRPIGLVIFDCDGVLIDSEVLACSTAVKTMGEFGFAITLEEYLGFVGRSARGGGAVLEARFGPLPAALAATDRARLFERFEAELQPMPGVREVVAGLSVPACVASSSDHDRLRLTLTLTGLHGLFAPAIFSATEVSRGKPAPDLFLHAAARMGVAPAACLVIEDSPAGVAAAVAAGMLAVGFVGGSHCGPQHGEKLQAAGAERVVGDMAQVAALAR